MGHSAWVVEEQKNNQYDFYLEILNLNKIVTENGMVLNLADFISNAEIVNIQSKIDIYIHGETYIDENGEESVKTLEIFFTNLSVDSDFYMDADKNFLKLIKSVEENFYKRQFYIHDINWCIDKAFRIILSYMRSKKNQNPLFFSESMVGFLTLNDLENLYEFYGGNYMKIKPDIWCGLAWEKMLELRNF
ncbi:hypothetical protein [Acinetobacter bereziniae]|uniref:Uncharacterized protein n=1 Tax=Acinetobacter bereziniae NIPH 3 TaxID=1217651 RepID=N8YNS0_ACIBZ|nr:hypothetical protein [Acinetobacter bereziniae]ENV22959.1 hypothetical protein F963_01212 [Acinetobacter bereziniae NIPH 3]